MSTCSASTSSATWNWTPLCAAIVDRLTFGGNIIETGTNSYPLAHTRRQRAATATADADTKP